jgi:hypothetical protein
MSLWTWFTGRQRRAATPKAAPARPPTIEGLEGRAMFSAAPAGFAGVSVNGNMSPSKVIPILRRLHVKEVRLWFGMKSWSNRNGSGSIKQAQQYHAAGFKVMMNVEAPQVPSYSEAVAFMKYLVSRKDALKAVDFWEIGNEPNRPPFWHGTPSQYVNTVLKAAWNVLHAAGEKVVGAGPTFDVAFCKKLVDAGYLKYVDYANFHPYGHTVDQVIQHMKGAIQVYKGKPVIFSEWNVRSATNTGQWISELNQIAAQGSHIAAYAFYFCLVKTNTLAGPAGLVTSSGHDNAGYASMFKKWFE